MMRYPLPHIPSSLLSRIHLQPGASPQLASRLGGRRGVVLNLSKSLVCDISSQGRWPTPPKLRSHWGKSRHRKLSVF